MLADYITPASIIKGCKLEDLKKLNARGKLIALFNFEDRIITLADGARFNIDRINSKETAERYKGNRLVEAASRLKICNQGKIFVDLEDARDVPLSAYGVVGNCIQYNRNVRDMHAALFPLNSYIIPSANGLGHADTTKVVDENNFSRKRPIVYWRGAMSGSRWKTIEGRAGPKLQNLEQGDVSYSRLRAVQIHKNKTYADIKLVSEQVPNVPQNLKDLFAPKSPLIEHLMYKYILVLKGNDVGSSLYWAISTNSLVIKEESSYETMADYYLSPWRDYVPCAEGATDLHEKFQYLEENENICLEIISSANRAYRSILSKESWDHALREMYGRLGLIF